MNQSAGACSRIDHLKDMFTKESADHRLSDEQIECLNTSPRDETLAILRELHSSPDPYVRSKSLDGLLNLYGIDHAELLMSYISRSKDHVWRGIYARKMAGLDDSRASKYLCSTLVNEKNSNVRYICVDLLGEIGDTSSVELLSEISKRDKGTNFEGRRISDACHWSIKKIMRSGDTSPRIDDWMSSHSPIALADLCQGLDEYQDDLTIFIERRSNWRADLLAIAVPSNNYIEDLMARYGMNYFLEVALAKEVLRLEKENEHGSNINQSESCETIIKFAASESYFVT